MKTSICFQCKGQALCPTGKVQPREATVSAITGCSRFQSKDKQTNAARLRAMTDEDLAEFLEKVGGCGPYFDKEYCNNGCPEESNCWLEWLRQEVEE